MEVDYLRYADSIRQGNQQRLSDLQAALAQVQQNKRQAAQDAIAQQEASRRATLADLQIGALKRENEYQQGLEGAMSNPRTLTSLTQGPVQTMPSLASLGGPSFGETPQYNGPMQPGVSQQTRTQSPAEAGAEYAMSRGRTEDAAKFISLNETMAKQAALARQYGDVEKAAQIDAAQERATKAAKLYSENKKAGGREYANQHVLQNPDLYGGLDPSNITDTGNGINQLKLANGQIVVWPDDDPTKIHLSAPPKEEKSEYKFREYVKGNKTVSEESQDGGRTWKPVASGPRKVEGGGSKPSGHGGMNIKMNGLNQEQREALSAAIGDGRLDPYKVNSKNQQVLADAAIANPGINLNDTAANLGLARNKDVQMKGAIAETVPPLLKKIVDSGKKLNYSDNQYLGAVQQWYDKKSNNPEFVRYMTLRNDQLLTLGGIMRSNGMTDMAQRLEEEAAHPTMSPRALEGWLSGQMESVEPRLKMYRSIRAGKGGVPAESQQGGNPAVSFIKGQYTAYTQHGLSENQIQQRIYSKLKSQKWSDQQIAAAWREYKGQ